MSRTRGDRPRRAIAAALLAIAALLPIAAGASPPPDTAVKSVKAKAGGDNSATFVRDQGDIAVIELSGNYDRSLPDGSFNDGARTVLAREFLRTHPDAYDMVVVVTGFPIATGTSTAFFHSVSNQVQGIGKPLFDNTSEYGSNGKLLGMIDMADLARYQSDVMDKEFERGMLVFAHEFLHQFAAYVKYRRPDGSISTGLLGQDGAHWSYLLDTNASVMYGSRWRDNGDGTFTSTGILDAYSPLDLYLMGLKKREDVPPFFLIDAPGVDATQLPLLGATVTGTRHTVTVDDIIAAEGPRIPSADASQKEFRLAFVYAVRPGQNVTPAEIAALGNIRRAVGTRFSALTGGVAHINVFTEPRLAVAPGTPAVLPPPTSAPATAVNVQQAVAYLKLRQMPDGSWSDTTPTAIRDSAVSLLALADLEPGFAGLLTGAQWLTGRETASTDFLSRKIGALAQLNRAPLGEQAAVLLGSQNGDGGWGAAAGYSSNPLDTALALQALARRAAPVDAAATRAFAYLRDKQNPDGGWGNVAGGTSRTTTSAQVLVALLGDTAATASRDRGKGFLAARQNSDGGFGDSPSSVHDTANVVAALMAINASSGIRLDEAVQYLSASQRVDGSWLASVYATALAANVLARVNAMNWAITAFTAAPARTTDGQRVTLTVTVRNTGNRNAPAGKLRVYAGDPAAGGVAVGPDADIPPLVAGQSAGIDTSWSTLGKAGTVTLFAVVDPERTQSELSVSDNTARLEYIVDPATAASDLLVSAADIAVSPARPAQIPSQLTITALLTNAGTADAANVRVVLWEGTGAARTQAGETVIATFPGRSTRPVSFTTTLTRAGATSYTVEIDPGQAITESDRANNSATITVATEVGIDLEVLASDISADKPSPRNGEDVQFSVKLRNRGTVGTPDFTVRYTMASPTGTAEIASNVIRLGAGQQVTQSVPYRTTQAGAHTFKVELDATGTVAESDEANNVAQYTFTVASDTGPSLAVGFQDIVATPNPALEGSPLALSALVRNVGSQSATDVEVAFYIGDPGQGGVQVGTTQVIATLAAGASQAVAVNLANVPDPASKLIFVVVDPANKIPADTTREDNRAFITVPVKTLPDLAVSSAGLTLTPAVPRPGDAVSLQARIDNLGQQPANAVLVRAFDGDPDAGGTQVGGDQTLALLAPQSGAVATFNWVFPNTPGDRVLHVRVDPLLAVNERFRANNAAQLVVSVQTGDATVSTRYFSPNGDGVQDTVDFTFRLQAPRTVAIQVRDADGTVVRHHSGPELAAIAAGRFTWDGRNDTGTVVRDGDYRLQATDGAIVVGEATVTLDNNRSPLIEALGTPFALKSNLSCQVPFNVGATFPLDDGSRAYMLKEFLSPPPPGDIPHGVYSLGGFGGDLRLVVPAPPSGFFWQAFLPAPDGARLALVRGGFSGSAFIASLWTASGEGANLRQVPLASLPPNPFNISPIGFSTSGDEVLFSYSTNTTTLIAAARVDGGGSPRVLETSRHGTALSPDRRKLLVAGFPATPAVIDVQSGSRQDLGPSGNTYFWAPDSLALAASDGDSSVSLYDANGVLQRVITMPPDWNQNSLSWGDDSSAFFFATSGPNFCRRDDATPCETDPVLWRVATESGSISEAFRAKGRAQPVCEGSGTTSLGINAARLPGQSQFLLSIEGFCGTEPAELRVISLQAPFNSRPVVENDDGDLVESVFAARDEGFLNSQFTRFVDSGRGLYYAGDASRMTPTTCSPQTFGFDRAIFRTLKNLTADLRPVRTASGFRLVGTATDAYFSRYTLDYARTESPTTWQPLAPASATPAVNAELTQWAPPGPGAYLIRLTVEDLAGNRREVVRRVNWGANSLITDLFRQPEYISPNGDGVQDKTVFHYRVLEPVNLVFNIFNDKGERVATATRSHLAIGVEAEFEWDGRGTAGAVVPDGLYKLTVLDYEFAIKVDTAPPTALQREGETGAPLARLALRLGNANEENALDVPDSIPYTPHIALDWSVADANFAGVVVQQGNAPVPTDWATLLESNRDTLRQPYNPVLLPFDTAARQPFRLIASDLAGNATTVTLELPETVVISNVLSGGTPDSWRRVASDSVAISDPSQGLTMEIVETVRAPIAEYAIEYQGPLPDGQLPGAAWSQRILPAPTLPPRFVLPAQQSIEGGFITSWDLRELTGSGQFFFRVRLTDQSGRIHRSADKRITKRIALEILGATLDSATTLKVDAEERLGELVAQLNLLVQSNSDPAFLQERVVWTRPGAATTAGLGKFSLVAEDRFRTCTTYNIRLQAVLADGRTFTSAPVPAESCTFAETVLKPQDAACDVPSSGKLRVELRAINEIQPNVRLGLLEFGRRRADGTDDVLFSQVNPAIRTTYSYELLTAPYAEGVHGGTGERFFTRVTDIENRRVEHPVRVVVDRTPVQARLTFPAAIQRVCARPETGTNGVIRSFVDLEGTIADTAGFDYVLQSGIGETPVAWSDIPAAPPACLTAFNRVRALGDPDSAVIASLNTEAYAGPAGEGCGPFQALAGTQFSGKLARLYGQHGAVSARLMARDWGGFRSCSQVSFFIDGKVEVSGASLDRTDIAPGRSDASGTATLHYGAEETVKITAIVYRKADVTIEPDGRIKSIAANAVPVRTLADAQPVAAGEGTFAWNGRDNGGVLVDDGLYVLFVSYEDGCGNLLVEKAFVITADRTVPLVAIAAPAAGAEVGGITPVRGSVSDTSLVGWVLEFGEGADPQTWTAIATGTQNVTDAALGAWTTLGLQPGPYTLRLRANDRFGNSAETRVAVTVRAGGTLVSAFELAPEIFSPNGDGRLDQSAIRYSLARAATVSVGVFQAGARVRLLADNAARPAGAAAIAFDGRSDLGAALPDGRYDVELVATDGVSSETLAVQVVIDRTAPQLAITSPVAGFTRGVDAVLGTIADDNLLDYTVRLRGIDVPGVNVLLDQGADVRNAQPLGSLLGFGEGRYELEVIARDRAENETRRVIAFEIDNTAPRVTLTSPAAGAVLGLKGNPFGVAGTIDERNLLRYRLNLGQGPPPAPQAELATGLALPLPSPLHALDVTPLADGNYTLQLVAEDRAGGAATASVNLTVDKTPPVAAFALPAENAYLRLGSDITGTATDANFKQRKLEIAPGPRATASRFTEFATSTEPAAPGTALGRLAALPPDGVQTLRLTVTDKADNTATALLQVNVDTVPPATPQGLAAVVQRRQDAVLTWNAVSDADLAGYLVYRGGAAITPAPIAPATFTDPGLTEGDHVYTVSAVDRAGNESARSAPATARVSLSTPTAQITAPARDSTVSGIVEIRGSANSPKDFKEFRLSVGEGATPASFTLLRRSTVPALGETLAQWNTFALAENALYTLQLESEDTFGTIGRDAVTVRIDNRAPARPVGLTSTQAASDVTLSWTANTEPDLDGYLLYRNGQLANAPGAVVTNLQLFVIRATTYVDRALRDGVYDYTVVAVDKAGNQSEPSSPRRVTIETRTPKAVIAKPAEGARIDRSAFVLATSEDNDLAQVQLQFRRVGVVAWTDLGPPLLQAPYGRDWDLSALPYDNYELRAVARDTGGRVDATPAIVRIVHARVDRPAAPGGLVARVAGGSVTLTWNAAPIADLAGYVVLRADPEGNTGNFMVTAPATTFEEFLGTDGLYRYSVVSLDTFGNQGDPGAAVLARVYSIEASQPYSPTDARSATITGTALPGLAVTLTLNAPSGTRTLAQPPNAQGNFSFPGLALEKGENNFLLVQADALGNTSREAYVHVQVGDRPAKPTGFVVTATGTLGQFDWNANGEDDLAGYYLGFDGAPRLRTIDPAFASASSQNNPVEYAIDGDAFTSWKSEADDAAPWLELGFDSDRLVSGVLIDWDENRDPGYSPAAFDIEGWDGEVWVKLAGVTGNVETSSEVAFAKPYYTDRLRIRMRAPSPFLEVAVSTVRVSEIETVDAPGTQLGPLNGRIAFTVTAFSTLGLLSEPSEAMVQSVGDTEPPEPVRLQATVSAREVTLTWTASASPDVVAYEVRRDAQVIATLDGTLIRTYLDSGLANGTYDYVVIALDDAANRSVPSNIASATVAVNATGQPRALQASALPGGRAIDLAWTAPATGTPPTSYSIERSLQAGGPYELIATGVTGTSYRDTGLTNGSRYFYRVFAVNATGDTGPRSVEASAIAQATSGPAAPVIVHPASAPRPATISTTTATVTGFAEPGSQVALLANGLGAGTTLAYDGVSSIEVDSGFNARLSPDGAWAIGGDSQLRIVRIAPPGEGEALGTPAIVKDFPGLNPVAFSWAANSRRAAYVFQRFDGARGEWINYAGYVDVDELVAHPADAVELDAFEIATSPDGRYAYVSGERDGSIGLWRIELATNTATLLFETDDVLESFANSPAGDALAYVREGRLEILDLATGQPRAQGAAQASEPAWAPGGDAVYYTADVASDRHVFRLDFSGAPAVQLTHGATSNISPSASPDGARIAYLANNSVRIRSLADGNDRELSGYFAGRLRWVDSGYIELDIGGPLLVVRPEGHFRIGAVFFTPGVNRLTATASVDNGPSSAISAAAIVTYSTADRPDLAVGAEDIVAIPGVPTLGEQVRVTVTVRNSGPRSAAAATFSLQAIDPDGAAQSLAERRLPALAPGASTAVVVDWTPARRGTFRLAAAVDRLNEIFEVSEVNNTAVREVTVVAPGVPNLEVATDAGVYPLNAAVTINARLTNGGSAFSGSVELQVEDAQGFVVTTLPAQAVQDLAFGQSLAITRTWNTATTLAGAYRVRARLRNAAGSAVTEATAAFSIDAPIAAVATLATDRAEYAQSATVHLLGRVTFPNGAGAGLTGEAVVRVLDTAGLVRFEQARALAFGTTADVNADWVLAAQATGDYTARLEVRLDGRVIAAASAAFKVTALTLQPPTVSLVTPAANAFFAAPARIAISAGASSPNAGGSIARVEFFAGASKLGEALAAPYAFDWTGVPAGFYVLTARATDNRGASAESAPVSVTVSAPPTVAIVSPANGANFAAPATVTIVARAADADGTIAKVEVFRGTLKLGECAAADCTVTWNDAPAGGHALTAVATDNLGLRTTSAPVAIIVGAEQAAPIVSLTSPAEGALAQAPGSFALAAQALSPNAGGSIAKVEFLAGGTVIGEALTAPYTFAWTGVPAGNYALIARATDNRGATANSAPVNVVVNAQPRVSITSPADGATFIAPATVAIAAQASDLDGTITKVEIFQGAVKLGECAASPCTASATGLAAGSYSFNATAADNRGGLTASAPVAIVVQGALLAPTVSLTAPAPGSVHQAPASIVLAASAASPNPGGAIAKVEFFAGANKIGEALAAPYGFTWTNVAAGAYALTARATDNRGVTATSAVVNVIVNAQPTVSITAPAANATFLAPATVAVSAAAQDSDGTIARIEVFQGATKLGECAATPCTVTWPNVAAGNYSLTARATDNRGGTATSDAVAIVVGTLSGTLTVTPDTVDVGQDVQFNARVQATVPATNLPLRVRVFNAATGNTLFESNTGATLAANTPFTWAFSWNTAGQPSGTFRVTLVDHRAGSDVVLAEATLTLRSTSSVRLSSVLAPRAQVLVLATCQTGSAGEVKRESLAKDDDGGGNANLACAAARKAYLDELLTELGIAHRVVTDVAAFRTELRCGTWNTFWISGGREKLRDRIVEELAEQVLAGKGLIVDGPRGEGNDGLDAILGVDTRDKEGDRRYTVVGIDGLLAASGFRTAGQAVRLGLGAGVTVHARFDSAGGDPAIVSRAYGRGRAVTIAFDFAAALEATTAAEPNMRPVLELAASGPLPIGSAVAARVTVVNTGTAGDVTLQAILPAGVTLRSATPPPASGATWTLANMAAGESRTLELAFDVPGGAGSYTLRFESGATAATLTFEVAAYADGTHAALTQALNALVLTGSQASARNAAVQLVNQSAAQFAANPETALYLLLDADKEVDKLVNAGSIPAMLARLANLVSGATCAQVAACMLPSGGSPTLGSYQVLVFGNAQVGGGGIQGSLGTKGNVQVTGANIASDWSGDSARLFSGGNVSYSTGSVGRAGSGIIRAEGSLSLSNVTRRSAVAEAAIEDWGALEAYYRTVSSQLGALASTAAIAGSAGTFTFRASNPVRNAFTLTSNQAAQARSLVFDVPATSTVIVNVTGSNATLTGGQQLVVEGGAQRPMAQHPLASRVLFNFPTASSVSISNWTMAGTLLAPRAKLTHQGGSLFGQAIVDELALTNVSYQQCGTFKGSLP